MIQKLLTLLLLSLPLFSQDSICIDEFFKQKSTLNFQKTYEDTNDNLSVDAILQLPFQKNTAPTTKETKSAFWVEFSFSNCTDKVKNAILKHPRPGLDQIDIYLFKGSQLVFSSNMGDMREQSNRKILYRNSMFMQELEPNTTYKMVTRLKSYGAYELYWMIEEPGYFTYYTSTETLIWGLFGGTLLVLFIYNFSLFMSLKDTAFLVYSLHVISALWHQYALNGIIYQYFDGINLNFLTLSAWVSPYISLTCLLLFPYYFFKLQKTILGKLLLFFAIFSALTALFYLNALWNMNFLSMARYITPISILMFALLITVSLSMIYKRFVGSFYFFLGQGTFLACSFYNIAIASAYLEAHRFSWLVVPVGLVFDVIFLSMALGKKMSVLQDHNKRNERMLLEQAFFYSIGQTVGNITHQWKTPISHISSQFMFLQATFIHSKQTFLKEFEATMPRIINSIDYVKESIDMFHNFYTNQNHHIVFSPKKEIETIVKILEIKLVLNSIFVSIDMDDISITGHKSAFSNIVMILFENSIDALLHISTEKRINISLIMNGDNVVLTCQDNAGGISPQHMDKLFTSQFTTKHNQGLGLGLSMAKNLAQKQLNGSIECKNDAAGAIFVLKFKTLLNKK